MKAFLLAAGAGTRLKPLTDHTPKCLVPICGRPLIEYWFDLFEHYNVRNILINTSHLAEQVNHYIADNSRGLSITLVHEDMLLGSGGTIRQNWGFVEDEDEFLIFYADNLTTIRLDGLQRVHQQKKQDFTLSVCRVRNPSEGGIVEINDQ